ncbi:kinase-like domain-containing protein [Armillaria borealis]|uniref:Kinase-like domain-containing protein n=1 Tax=Armillaria borealis TaxID=47425 RepID=A0AA39MK03_9AGAR|nr:kinase-like domain-containing protein [Armillaria borealis]
MKKMSYPWLVNAHWTFCNDNAGGAEPTQSCSFVSTVVPVPRWQLKSRGDSQIIDDEEVGDKVKAGYSHAINAISRRAGAVVLPVSTTRKELGPTVSLSQDLCPSLMYALRLRNVRTGTYSSVFNATELESGKTVALKTSHVSMRVKRPILQRETRIIQLLKAMTLFPFLFRMHGYGDSGVKCCTAEEEEQTWTGVMLANVIETVDKMLAGLEHIHSHRILLRAIKPENLLCALNDLTIKTVDFGISKPFSHRQPSKDEPLKERRVVIGSLHWASLNSNIRMGQFTLAPLKPHPREESQMRLQEAVGQMKPGSFGKDLQVYPSNSVTCSITAIPSILISFLTTERSGACLGIWRNEEMDEPKSEVPREGEDNNDNGGDGLGEDTYFAMDIDMLEHQGERAKNFILLVEQEADLDSSTPLIAEALHE